MLASPPGPRAAPTRELSADHVRALLVAGGYGNAAAVVRQRYSLPAGCGVSLQFGGEVVVDGDVLSRSILRCEVVLNGSDAHIGHAACWTVDKFIRVCTGGDRFGLAMDVRLVLGSRVFLDDILAHGGDVFRHLRLLLADARATALSLPVADEAAAGSDGPALRIEARYAGDLAAGRSGFVDGRAAGGRPIASAARPWMLRIAARRKLMIAAACDCLADHILPDLARALRELIAREMASMRRLAPCEIGSKRHPASPPPIFDAQDQPFDLAELAETLPYEPPP
jgi:hypothetical protein